MNVKHEHDFNDGHSGDEHDYHRHHSYFQVHRDVKSENVLIDSMGYCLLADMGLAAFCTPESDQTQAVKGRSSLWHNPPIEKRENHLLTQREGCIVRANRCFSCFNDACAYCPESFVCFLY